MGLVANVYLVLCLLCGSGDGTATSIPQVSLAECLLRADAIARSNPKATAFCTPSAGAFDQQVAYLVSENRRLDARMKADLAATFARTPAEQDARLEAYYQNSLRSR